MTGNRKMDYPRISSGLTRGLSVFANLQICRIWSEFGCESLKAAPPRGRRMYQLRKPIATGLETLGLMSHGLAAWPSGPDPLQTVGLGLAAKPYHISPKV